MATKKHPHDEALKALRALGLSYPGTHTKSPWPGHADLAVKDKTFAYLSLEGEPLRIGCKLPQSAQLALELPFSQPTPYGLGKSGWVSAELPEDEPVPLGMLKAWLEESYRAQAPKKLVAQLDGTAGAATAKKATAKKATAKKATAKKATAKKASAKKATAKKATAKKATAKKATAKATKKAAPSRR